MDEDIEAPGFFTRFVYRVLDLALVSKIEGERFYPVARADESLLESLEPRDIASAEIDHCPGLRERLAHGLTEITRGARNQRNATFEAEVLFDAHRSLL